jgi:hypothetical protein
VIGGEDERDEMMMALNLQLRHSPVKVKTDPCTMGTNLRLMANCSTYSTNL